MIKYISGLVIILGLVFAGWLYNLYDEIKQDMQCKVELDHMEGIFPTITPFGMAALLPHKELKVDIRNNKLKVLIDGESTDMPNREKVLQKAN